MTRLAIALCFLVACGGSGASGAAPDSPAANGAPASSSAREVLTVAPFVLTITGTRADGGTQTRIFRGTADGVISAEQGGVSKELVKVTSEGILTPLTGGSGVVHLSPEGTLSIDGEAMPGRVDDDGTVYRGDTPILAIRDGEVIDLAGDILSSKVTMNGEVVSETTFVMSVEGGDEVRELVAVLLLLQMSAPQQREPAPEPTVAPAPEPATP